MKIVACSDAHLDWTTTGVSRFDEIESAMNQAVMRAVGEKADAFVFCGDLCDPDSGPIVLRCAEVALTAARVLANAGIVSVWLAGNHDTVGDSAGTTSLTPLRAISGKHLFVVDTPTRLCVPGWSHDVIALPHLAQPEDYARAFRNLIAAGITDKPLVVLSHLTVPGIDPGEETTEMPRGAERVLPIAEIEARPDVACVLQGHYHSRGSYFLKDGRACIGNPGAQIELHVIGSLARLTFGEEKNRPGYLVVEV